jgi:predicted DNA-binding transcriptional regulator AlpA
MSAVSTLLTPTRAGEVLDAKRAAMYCGIARQTLYNLRYKREGPVAHYHGRKTVFYPADLDAWLESRIRPDPTGEKSTSPAERAS